MKLVTTSLVLAALALSPLTARAHCDTLDGPVVKTARAALDANDPAPVLAWVKAPDEGRIRTAFRDAVAARTRSPSTSERTDHRFFETLVKVHRAGEGAPYTGLKPAGGALPLAVVEADRALETGDTSAVEDVLIDALRSSVRSRFAAVQRLPRPAQDVAAGRAWVEAYVTWVHHVEALAATANGAAAHGAEQAASGHTSAAGHGQAVGVEEAAADHRHTSR